MGCYEVTLNVWEGNDTARRFYEKMGMVPKETQMEFILKQRINYDLKVVVHVDSIVYTKNRVCLKGAV